MSTIKKTPWTPWHSSSASPTSDNSSKAQVVPVKKTPDQITETHLENYINFGLRAEKKNSAGGNILNVISITPQTRGTFVAEMKDRLGRDIRAYVYDVVPHLVPLKEFINIDEITDIMTGGEIIMARYKEENWMDKISPEALTCMYKHHIDVFDLIDYKLAVSKQK